MKNAFIIIRIWALVTASGCMNLDLTKEIELFDSDSSSDSGDTSGGLWSPDQAVSGGNVVGSDSDSVDAGTPGDTADTDGAEETGGVIPETDPSDEAAPELMNIVCDSLETPVSGCCVATGAKTAALHFVTDEPATVEIVSHGGDAAMVLKSGYETEHAVLVRNLSSAADSTVVLRMTDVNNNTAKVEVPVRGGEGETVSITEVLADPFGAEPAQEFVEIANYGVTTVDLSGWMVDDEGDRNGDLIPDGSVLLPGEAALLVSENYSVLGGADPAPPEGTRIFRIGSSIGSSGLKNSISETIELTDLAGKLVSRYLGTTGNPQSGVSDAKRLAELPELLSGIWGYDSASSCTPGIVPLIAPVVSAP